MAHRLPSEIETQLTEFRSIMAFERTDVPADDFAAQLQIDAWQNHMKDLERELAESRAFNKSQTFIEAYDGVEPFIFVSYAHEDKKVVYPEIADLTGRGYRIWYDEGLIPSLVFADEIARKIESAAYFLVFLSPDAIKSKYVRREIEEAIRTDKLILAVHIEKTELSAGLRMFLGPIQALNKYELPEDYYRRKLLKALKAVPQTLGEKPPTDESGTTTVRNDGEKGTKPKPPVNGTEKPSTVATPPPPPPEPQEPDLDLPVTPYFKEDLSNDKQLASTEKWGRWRGMKVPMVGGIPLFKKINIGKNGTVYYGIHSRHREVAVKVLPFQMDDREVKRIHRGANKAREIKSPNLVRMLDARDEGGFSFVVMEYIFGERASKHLESRLEKGNKAFSEGDALDAIIAATEGLCAAHAHGVIHRNLSPENLLIPYQSREDKICELAHTKLMDTALARDESEKQVSMLTIQQDLLGIPGYMSPEQIENAKSADKRSDVFGAGATLYALLAGRPPFFGNQFQVISATLEGKHDPIEKFRPDVSDKTVELIERCLQRDPADRYADSIELLAALMTSRTAYRSAIAAGTPLKKSKPLSESQVPEVLNTYVMSGEGVAKQLQAMRAKKLLAPTQPKIEPTVISETLEPTLPSIVTEPGAFRRRKGTVRGHSIEDLSNDRLLMPAPRIQYEGITVPALGGIPLLRLLGRGGMGSVYYGIHTRLDREVAVKVMSTQRFSDDSTMRQRFNREARLSAMIQSPHLVRIFDTNEENGLFYITTEFVDGPSADRVMRDSLANSGASVSESIALDICIAACKGLSAAHEQDVIHRDVKPANVLVPMIRNSDKLAFDHAMLADLGLARFAKSDTGLTMSNAAMGTPGYMPPEQFLDSKSVRKPADVFGMGATLYTLLAGKSPFAGESPYDVLRKTNEGSHEPLRSLRPDTSQRTARLIDKALQKDPLKRFADATEMLMELQACRLELEASKASRSAKKSSTPPIWERIRRAIWGTSDTKSESIAPASTIDPVLPTTTAKSTVPAPDIAHSNPGTVGTPPPRSAPRKAPAALEPRFFEDLSADILLLPAPRVTYREKQIPCLGRVPLFSKLGKGGMGAVYYAVHPRLDVEVAVKVLPFDLADKNAGFKDRFKREAQLAARTQSPHVVRILDVDEENTIFYLIMEYVHGATAGDYLKNQRTAERAGVTENEALDIGRAATAGLAALHVKGCVHRDIKPANLLIPEFDAEELLLIRQGESRLNFGGTKVADLGLAMGRSDRDGAEGAKTLGTPGYMAPEQIDDADNVGLSADVFGMGATLYALLAGRSPFSRETPMETLFATQNDIPAPLKSKRPDVSETVCDIVDRCIRRNQDERFANGQELLNALRKCTEK